MNSRPVRWRTSWALAQVTGVLFSTLVWAVLLATWKQAAAAALAGGVVIVVLHRTPLVLRLVFGARPAALAERDAVWASIIPVASLRGRNQPQAWVGRGWRSRAWDVLMPNRRTLLVAESVLAGIRTGRVSDLEVSGMVAHAAGQLPVRGSRIVAAVGLYCLPWTLVETITSRVAARLGRVPLMRLSWRMRPVVFGLGLVDAVGNTRWEAAIPLAVFTVLTYTTGPARSAWQRKLAGLGDRRVADDGLGPVFARVVLDSKYPGDPTGSRPCWR